MPAHQHAPKTLIQIPSFVIALPHGAMAWAQHIKDQHKINTNTVSQAITTVWFSAPRVITTASFKASQVNMVMAGVDLDTHPPWCCLTQTLFTL